MSEEYTEHVNDIMENLVNNIDNYTYHGERIKKYRKKPVIIEAVKYTDPDSVKAIIQMAGSGKGITNTETHLHILTLEGVMIANKGDYVIKGIAGEIYPCKPDIFKALYDMVK